MTPLCEQACKAAVCVQGESGDLPIGTSPSFYRTLTHRTSWILDKVDVWQSSLKSRTLLCQDITCSRHIFIAYHMEVRHSAPPQKALSTVALLS